MYKDLTGGRDDAAVLITGGAGFIGTNLAHRVLRDGGSVVILDNLSRSGVAENIAWLHEMHSSGVRLLVSDIRDRDAVRRAVRGVRRVFHFAAQVAVTSSLCDPRADFETNVVGTMNVLEAIRSLNNPPPLLYTSTNKVYGGLDDVALDSRDSRYEPRDASIGAHGIDEGRGLAFHTPYGCSKGAADQYVLDYSRSFGIQSVVFRMSCIYGPHQFGCEDQGWVAHFLMRASEGEPITIYGSGKQVRDVLFVEDLVEAMLAAHEHLDITAGQAFNIGGGPENTISLLELTDLIGRLNGAAPDLRFAEPRQGDQRYFVSDVNKFFSLTGWRPRTSVVEGVSRLNEWLPERRSRIPVIAHAGRVSA